MAGRHAHDFSAQLDKLWNYGKPAESQVRFRAELARYPAGSREALETGRRSRAATACSASSPKPTRRSTRYCPSSTGCRRA